MKKWYFLFLMCVMALGFTACSNDDDETLPQLCVVLDCSQEDVDLSGIEVSLQSVQTQQKDKALTDAAGKAVFTLPLGQYHLTAEKKDEKGVTIFYASKENVTLKESNQEVHMTMLPISETLDKTFLLNELYFNCSKVGDWGSSMYESYLTITNVSDKSLYADGLAIAVSGDYNDEATLSGKEKYLPENIVVSQYYTIPGNGSEYLVEPGKSIVIAHSAINHKENVGPMTPEGNPNARDLSGADFEIFVPHEYVMTVDNPEVPNMDMSKSFTTFQAFQWGYTGYAPMMLVRAKTDDIATYIKENLKNMEVTGSGGSMHQDYLVIPTEWVIDGCETAPQDFVRKVLPASIDRTRINVPDANRMMGGFKQILVVRKADADGKLIDTNDSANDFEVTEVGDRHYPKK